MSTNQVTYTGHSALPHAAGLQGHSCGLEFARYGLVMWCIESKDGKRLWQAKQGRRIVFSHPDHNKALAGAVMLLTGA